MFLVPDIPEELMLYFYLNDRRAFDLIGQLADDCYLCRVDYPWNRMGFVPINQILLKSSEGWYAAIIDDGDGPHLQGKINAACKLTKEDLEKFQSGNIPELEHCTNYRDSRDFFKILWKKC